MYLLRVESGDLIHSRTSRKGWQNRTNGYLTNGKGIWQYLQTERSESGPKIAADPIVSKFLPFFYVDSFQNKLYYNTTINSTLMKRHTLSCWKCLKNTKSLQWLSPQSSRWVNSHVPFPQEINATERQNLTQRSSFACLFCARNRFFIQNKRCKKEEKLEDMCFVLSIIVISAHSAVRLSRLEGTLFYWEQNWIWHTSNRGGSFFGLRMAIKMKFILKERQK